MSHDAITVDALEDVRALLYSAGHATDPERRFVLIATARRLFDKHREEVRLLGEALDRAEELHVKGYEDGGTLFQERP